MELSRNPKRGERVPSLIINAGELSSEDENPNENGVESIRQQLRKQGRICKSHPGLTKIRNLLQMHIGAENASYRQTF